MKMGVCAGCGKTAMVNFAAKKDKNSPYEAGDYCADCYERMDLSIPLPKSSKPATPDTDPSWDNVVRASEGD